MIDLSREAIKAKLEDPERYPELRDKADRDLREYRERRGWWRLQGLRHFEAPNVIYISIDRFFYFQADGLNVWPLFDCGLVAENIMLLATKYGLGTIAQAQAVVYPSVLRKILGIPDSKLIVLGIAIGYPNWDDPINQTRSPREPLDKVAKWYGFDDGIA